MNQQPVRRPKPITQRDGSSLQNANCRMASVSTGLDYHTNGKRVSTGARMRAHQDDQSGGTDSRDAKQAWDRGYSQTLIIEDGSPFSDAIAALRKGKAVNLDVWHETLGGPCLSGSGRYGHNIFVLPDFNGEGWLVSDPWCKPASWARVSETKLRRAAEEWGRRVFDSAGDSGLDIDDSGGDPNPQTPEDFQAWMEEAAKRLMERWNPGRPAPAGEGDDAKRDDDTGGANPVLFTTTKAMPLKGQEDEGLDKLMGTPGMFRVFPVGTPHFNKPGGTQEGTIKNSQVVYSVVAKYTDEAGKHWFLINGGSDGNMGWVRDADMA